MKFAVKPTFACIFLTQLHAVCFELMMIFEIFMAYESHNFLYNEPIFLEICNTFI